MGTIDVAYRDVAAGAKALLSRQFALGDRQFAPIDSACFFLVRLLGVKFRQFGLGALEDIDDLEVADYVEAFAVDNPVESGLVRDMLLEAEISCFVRQMSMSMFPTSIGRQSEFRIAVQVDKIEDARVIVRDAIARGELEGSSSDDDEEEEEG